MTNTTWETDMKLKTKLMGAVAGLALWARFR